MQHLGPYRLESLIDAHEEGTGTAYRVTIAPQQRTSVSFHRVAEEWYYVLSGSGTAVLNGQGHSLVAGDFLHLAHRHDARVRHPGPDAGNADICTSPARGRIATCTSSIRSHPQGSPSSIRRKNGGLRPPLATGQIATIIVGRSRSRTNPKRIS